MLNTKLFLDDKIFTDVLEQKALRDGYGDGVVEAGTLDNNVVVLCGDLTESTRSLPFSKKFPDRFFQVGVAEQNMAGISAGLSLSGKVPFMSSYSAFSPMRNLDQIRTSVCYTNANVKIVSTHAGFSAGKDGATHQAFEDLAIARVLPNMTVIHPSDYHEAKKAVLAAASIKGPVYIRLTRDKTPSFTTEKTPFEIGKAQILFEGTEITIISSGLPVYRCLKVAKKLLDKKHSVEVINCATVKPLDEKTILESVKKTKKVLIVEEHQVAGGLGGAICELLSEKFPVKVKILGMNDMFGESGGYDELLFKYGLDEVGIEKEVLHFLKS